MIESAGEWYLRRRAEDELLAGVESTLESRARALIAVDLLSPEVAVGVLDVYGRARRLRGLPPARPHVAPRSPVGALTPPRVSACGRTLTQPWGTVTIRYIASTAQLTTIAVTMTRGLSTPSRHFGPVGHGGPPTLTVGDDRGRRRSSEFSGGGSDDEWQGRYTISPALPPDTAWITVFGERIELADSPSDVSVTVESFARDVSAEELAERHLTRCLETPDLSRYGRHALSIAIDTYVACGLLDADGEVVRQAFAVEELLHGATVGPATIPDRWRSVRARQHRDDGLTASRVVGATTPVFDGIRVAVLDLRSADSGFTIDFEAAGGVDRLPGSMPDELMFTTTAVDDRGNHYLGHLQQFGSGSEGMRGAVEFTGPLDPSASVVDLQFTTDRAQATVRVPLRWDGAA